MFGIMPVMVNGEFIQFSCVMRDAFFQKFVYIVSFNQASLPFKVKKKTSNQIKSYPSNRSGLSVKWSFHISLSRFIEYIGMAIASPFLNSAPSIVLFFVHFPVSMVAMLGKEVYQYVKLLFTVRSDIKHKKKKYCVMYNLCIA